jgi:hypothetical protein
VDGFGDYRTAASAGIERAGGHAVLVNEDFPAVATNPRNACLDGVDSSDIYLCIIGSRGGWTAPSGVLVTEEEYQHAMRRGLPILAFIVEGEKDRQAQAFADRVSHYVSGRFRAMVTDPADLQDHVHRALEFILPTFDLPMTQDSRISEALQRHDHNQQDTTLRIVLSPERAEEVIDAVQFGSSDFVQLLYRIGHDEGIRLFDYRCAKDDSVAGNRQIIEQECERDHRHGRVFVRVELEDSGLAVIDANVSGRAPSGGADAMAGSLVVLTGDMTAVAAQAFAFYGRLFAQVDPYERHQSFVFNAGLLGLDYRTIADVASTGGSQALRMTYDKSPIIAFDRPRKVSRQLLVQPDSEIERTITMLRRRAQA